MQMGVFPTIEIVGNHPPNKGEYAFNLSNLNEIMRITTEQV